MNWKLIISDLKKPTYDETKSLEVVQASIERDRRRQDHQPRYNLLGRALSSLHARGFAGKSDPRPCKPLPPTKTKDFEHAFIMPRRYRKSR
jgi:hypothetical protein